MALTASSFSGGSAGSYLSAGAISRIRYEREQEAKAAAAKAAAAAARAAATAEADKDRGGLWGGLGYVGEKFAVGLVSGLEGIVDYTASGLAKLFGNDTWAEEIISDDWFGDWYSHPEEWFNPSKGWQVAGDVAGGIGTSIPSMATAVGLTVATAGMAAPASAAIVAGGSFLTSGLGAAGNATKEAYRQTGKLGGKEYGYGALVGATEGGVEVLGNLLSFGSGAVVKSVSKMIGKEASEAFAKQGILKTMGKSFLGEAIEEGFSEWITPYWQKVTYDPKAKDASLDEILYASLVGGLSGLVMEGGRYSGNNAINFAKGNKLAISNGDAQALATAGDFASFEELNQTGDELFSFIADKRKSLLESLSKTNGKAVTIQQKTDLGALERANIAGAKKVFVATRAQNIVNNAETIAERLTAYGYKTADGKPITFTAAEITEGYDPKKPSSIYKALKNNSKLRELAVADATGQLMMDTNEFVKATLMGKKLASQVDINRFYENATREELQAVTDALKIDSWEGLTAESFAQKISDFLVDGGAERAIDANERRAAFAALTQEAMPSLPKYANMAKDSMTRYSDGQIDLGIERRGDIYRTYNYKTGDLSKDLTSQELNSFLRDYGAKRDEYAAAERQRIEAEQKRKNEVAEIDNLARKNIKDYKSLNAPNQSMIRRLIREGRAKGLSDSDVLMYAKVSAHSGIDIQFDKEANYRGVKDDGSADYADGFYEAAKNRIVVNPEGKRTAERLLIHELDHAIRKYFDSEGKPATRIYLDAIEGVDQTTRDRITETYKKTAKPGEFAAVVMDETNAYYAEQVLGNKYTLEKLIEAEPTLKEKILNFFKGASSDYADVPKLSGAAKKYYRTYKKLFDEFSARNAQSNASENAHLSTLFENNTQKMSITNMNQGNMSVSDREYAVVAQEDGKLYVTATRKVIKSTTLEGQRKEISHFFDVLLDGQPSIDIHTIEGDVLTITKADTADKARDNYKTVQNKRVKLSDDEFRVKLNAESHIDELAEISTPKPQRVPDGKNHPFAKDGFTYRTAYFEDFDGKYYRVTLSIGNNGTIATVYNVGEIKENVPSSAKIIAVMGSKALDETFSDISIHQPKKKINTSTKKSSKQHALDLGDSNKKVQFDIIQKTNPMYDEYHVGIRSADDIRTWEEVLKLDDEKEGQFVWGDFSRADAEQALKNGKVTVYSSYPIKNGVFVSTSYIQAEEYSGGRGGKVYSKTVPLDKIAWINGDEGQYADVTTSSGKQYALDIEAVDREYSSAVERGDMETTQRMVDEAAKKAGYTRVFYHGAKKGGGFTVFRDWSYFTENKAYAERYADREKSGSLYTTYVKLDKPFDTRKTADRRLFNEIRQEYGLSKIQDSGLPDWTDGYDISEYIDENELDYDGIILDEGGDMVNGKPVSRGESYVVRKSAQIKSADPVTYDDNGRVIPISERFNERNSDIRYALDIDSEGENISGAEVMSWLKDKPKAGEKLNPEETVARGLPYKKGKSSLTAGEVKKLVANSTREKVYSKGDALKVVNRMSGTWGLTVKARDEIADTVWQFLNDSPDVEYRRDIAHDIAEYTVAKVLMDSKTENPDALEAAERLSYLRTGIGKLSFSDADITELRHAVDEKGLKRLMGRWGFKGSKKAEGVSGGYVARGRAAMDVFVTEVAREMPGMEYLSEMHPAEAMLEIDRVYSKAYADSKDKWISQYWDMPDSEIPSMVKDVEESLLNAYENVGEKSRFTKLMEEKISRYEKRAERFKAERDEIKGRDRILGLLMNEATKMKDLKLGTFANATQHESDVLRGSVERLSRLQFRGNLNVSGARNIISELRLWYNQKNSILGYKSEQDPGYYVQAVSDMLDALADGEGGFTKADLMMLYDVMAYFNNFVENFGKVYRKGRWVDAEPEAKRYVKLLQDNEKVKVGPLRRIIGSRYMQTFGDPMTVARRMDMYEKGFYSEMLEELREGAVGAQIAEMEVREEYDKFLTENRKYIEKAANEKIVYQGVNVPKMHLIGVYMTLKRKHSRAGLAENGFAFDDLDGKRVRVNGFALDAKDLGDAEIDKRSEEQLDILARKFTDKDLEYIKILEKAYNVDARKLKADRDMQRLGYTNAGMGYYYPIRRGNIAKNVDSADYMAELDRVSNSSFNKNTVRGARQELFIENADVVFRRHVRAVCQYSYLSPAVETYNKLYNLDVSGNANHPTSVATEGANTWDAGNKYFVKLISDIQGIPAVSGEGAEILAKIRGGYAKYQLGANPKVWFTQLSSFFASSSRLDPLSIIKGAGVSAEGVDKYCPLAKLRNSENTAAIAQAVLDTRGKRAASKIERFSDALMAPIGKMDRFVVSRLFGAAQVQIEKEGGGKVGTEKNKIAAGKLLTEVILETQQNSIATERSAAMRSGNEIVRTSTMFTSDSMKVTGRVIDSIGEALTLKQRIKTESDADVRKTLEERYKDANKRAGKALGAMLGSAVYMACIAQLFRFIYDKDDDEEKNLFETMTVDVIGNMTGGLPLIKDVYTKLFEGYDVGNFTYSAINDLIDSTGDLLDIAGSVFEGKMDTAERNRALRNLSYSVGQLTGLPTRNVYNVVFGLTKRFSPTTAFTVDSWFYEKNYQNELARAIEKGDNKMASFILGLMLEERIDEEIPADVFDEILALTKAGEKVLPRTMPDSFTVGGVEYPISDSEREAMKKIYSKCEGDIAKLITTSSYKAMSAQDRALAIDHIYDSYYAKALEEVCGVDGGKRTKLLGVLGADKLARYYVSTRGIESDKDRLGNTVEGSKRKKVVAAINGLGVSLNERLLLICASGYALKDGDVLGASAETLKKSLLKYILSMKLSVAEKAEIAEMCGFEVKNGRIVNNFSSNLKELPRISLKTR